MIQCPVLGRVEPLADATVVHRLVSTHRRKNRRPLAVVSGDMIEGTITPRLLERMDRGTTSARLEQVGSLPTVAEFAFALIQALHYDLALEHCARSRNTILDTSNL